MIEKEFENFGPVARQILKEAAAAAAELSMRYIGSEHLLLGILRVDCTASRVLQEVHVTAEKTESAVRDLIAPAPSESVNRDLPWSRKAREILKEAERIAGEADSGPVSSDHLLLAVSRDSDCTAIRLLNTMQVSYEALLGSLADAMGPEGEKLRKRQADGTLGTSVLDRYSRDLTALAAEGRLDPVIGREKELNRVLQVLSRRTKNNPCLIGEPGVGKTAIVEALAARIAAGDVPDTMLGKRIAALDLSGMVAGTKYRGEFEERIKKVISEVTADRSVILFLDEIHTLIGAGGAEGSLDAANILKPALSRGEVQLIGATTVDEYRKHIEKDAALERRFQPLMIEEPSEEETQEILKGLSDRYAAHHRVRITEEALKACVTLSARYVGDRFLPDKAIDLMDEACAVTQLSSHRRREKEDKNEIRELLEQEMEEALMKGDMQKVSSLRAERQKLQKSPGKTGRSDSGRRLPAVTEERVAEVVSGWTGIPLKRLAEKESERLLQLEKTLHRRVVGQEEAVRAVAKAVRRGRVRLTEPGRPIGSFLFLGPTGVGKTELAKALAEAVFGRESAMIRIDMSEYMEKHSVSRLLGSPPGYVGYEEGGQFSEKVRRNPYTVILFDEIEKAHPDVFNVLLQILDDGRVTDSQGRTVDFRNTILIMTSNAGAERIVEPKKLGFSAGDDAAADHSRMKSAVMEEVKRLFRPEFLNRIDEIIVFHALTQEHMKEIFTIQLRRINRNLASSHQMHLQVQQGAREELIRRGYDPRYGARPLKRVLQQEIEDALADAFLSGKIRDGEEIRAVLKEGKVELFPVKKKK